MRRRQLADRTQDRFVVVKTFKDGTCQRRTYTDYGDAAAITKRCARNRANKPCYLTHGPIGAEKLVAVCAKTRCSKPTVSDKHRLDKCRGGSVDKKKRRALIATRVRHTGTSKATPSRIVPRSSLPAELQGRKRRR